MNDPEMIEIFGKPNKVTDHFRPTTKGTYENGNRCGGGTCGSSVEKWKSTDGKIYLDGNDINQR